MRLVIFISLFVLLSSSAVSQLDQFERELMLFGKSLRSDTSILDEFDSMGMELEKIQAKDPITKYKDPLSSEDPAVKRDLDDAKYKRVKDPDLTLRMKEASTDAEKQQIIQRLKEKRQLPSPNKPEQTIPEKQKKPTFRPILVWGIIVFFGAILLVVLFKMLRRSKKSKKIMLQAESSIAKLERQMQKQNEELDLAKEKYHRRELDEESFKAIVKENQQRLIKLEVEMKSIRRTIDKKT